MNVFRLDGTPFNLVFRDTVGIDVGEVAQPEGVGMPCRPGHGRARLATGTTIDINRTSYVR